jgi:uncharacterized RDD family membrane protein YckC
MQPESDSSISSLSVDTPEQVQLQLAVAGLGTRSIAFLIDYGIVFMTLVTLLLGVQIATRQSLVDWPWATSHLLLPAVILTLFLLFWGYFLIFEWLWNGQTPGKRAMRIRVVKDGGYPISFFDSVVRNLLRAVDCYFPPFFFAVGIVCIFAHSRHKRIGDLAAGTIVVVEHPLSFIIDSVQKSSRPPAFHPVLDSLMLTVEEIDLVESYLKRRSELDGKSAVALREELVQYLLAKLNSHGQLTSIPPESQDAFLEEAITTKASSRAL